jgi:type VI secretion system protein ImpH
MFDVAVEIDEFVGSYLEFEPDQRTRLGAKNSGLGTDMLMGAAVFSIEDKFRVRVYVEDMAQYISFLPTGNFSEPLADLIFFYVGDQLSWEVELAIPAGKVEPMRLSKFGQLGWTSWMSPKWVDVKDAYRRDARFHPADILKQRRERAARRARG